MGKLALAGAVAGAGKGIAESAQLRQETEAKKETIDYSAMKEEQLARLRGGIQADISREQQESITERERMGDQRAAEQALLEREHESEEGRLERESEERIAKMSAEAKGGTTPNWMKERWSFSKMTGGEDVGFAEQLVLRDEKTGIQYVQQGDKLVEAGRTEVGDAPGAALDYLAENLDESTVNQFATKYGYVPSWVMRARQ